MCELLTGPAGQIAPQLDGVATFLLTDRALEQTHHLFNGTAWVQLLGELVRPAGQSHMSFSTTFRRTITFGTCGAFWFTPERSRTKGRAWSPCSPG